jgi:hypothetical protein
MSFTILADEKRYGDKLYLKSDKDRGRSLDPHSDSRWRFSGRLERSDRSAKLLVKTCITFCGNPRLTGSNNFASLEEGK